MPRSALGTVVTTLVSVLLVAIGSVDSELTREVLDTVPVAAADRTPETVIVADSPVKSVPAAQRTDWPATVQDHPAAAAAASGVALTPVMTFAKVSVTSGLRAEEGPSLVTTSVQLISSPGVPPEARSLLRVRSDSTPTLVVASSELLPVSGSGVPESTLPMLAISPTWSAARVPAITMSTAGASGSMSGPVQVRNWPASVQFHSVSEGVTIRSDTSSGTSSVNTGSTAVEGPTLVTLAVHWIGPPATGVCPDSDLATARSALGMTSAVAEAVLLPGTGSSVLAVALAALARVPEKDGSRLPETVTVAAAPGASVAAPQSMTPDVPAAGVRVQLQPGVEALVDTAERPTGRVSRMLGETDVEGPALVRVNVHVTASPGVTGVGDVSVFSRTRSAVGRVGVVLVDELSPGTESVVAELSVAVLTRSPVIVAARVPVRVNVTEVAGAMLGVVHRRVPVPVQVHPLGALMDAPVTPVGRVSVSATPVATDGPALATVIVQLTG